MPYMYILECADGSYYTGSTWDLERRLWEHQNGIGANHTARRLPVKLVYCEYYERIADAFYREKQVQGWSRRKKQALIEQNFDKLIEYSRNYTQYPPQAAASTSSAAENEAQSPDPLPVPTPLPDPLPDTLPDTFPDTLPELVEGNATPNKETDHGG